MFKLIEGLIRIMGLSGNIAEVDSSNRLLVATPPPAPPLGTTEQGVTLFDNVNGNNVDYDYFVIPTGQTLTLQRFVGGSEGSGKESYVALWSDPTGTNATGAQDDGAPSWDLITLGFTMNSNFSDDLNQEFVGDGTARIVMQRRRLDNAARLMFARWSGFSQ